MIELSVAMPAIYLSNYTRSWVLPVEGVIQHEGYIYCDPLLVTDAPVPEAELRALSLRAFQRAGWRGDVVLDPPLSQFALVLEAHVDGLIFVLIGDRRWRFPASTRA